MAGMLCTFYWLATAVCPPSGRPPQAVACVYEASSTYASPFRTRTQLPAQGTHVGFVSSHVSPLCWLRVLAARQVTCVTWLPVSPQWAPVPGASLGGRLSLLEGGAEPSVCMPLLPVGAAGYLSAGRAW